MKGRILITGAGGFIGYQLSNYLARAGYRVTGVDIRYPRNFASPQFDAQILDFRNSSQIDPLLKGKEAVFHLASAHLTINMDESEYWDINVHSIPQLLEQSRSLGVKKFIHVSSVGVYGNLKTWPANEETACYPQSIYGHTKLAGEKKISEFSEKTGFPVTIIRPTWVYGPTCPRTRKLYKTLNNRTFMMIGAGNNLRHPVYISDLLEAFRLVMERDDGKGDVLIIGGKQALTTRDIIKTFCTVFQLKEPVIRLPLPLGKLVAVSVEKMFSVLGKEPPFSTRSLEFFETNNAFSITEAAQRIGFKPAFSFEAGLRDFYKDLKGKE